MAIDSSGEWWRGTQAADLDRYLAEFRAGGYPVTRVVHATCADCSGSTFHVLIDDEEGYAERRCTSCAARFVMLDSADFQDEADPEGAACPCGNETFEVAAGFALRNDGDIRWASIGLRCVGDGILGVYTDWKIDYSPTAHLYGRV